MAVPMLDETRVDTKIMAAMVNRFIADSADHLQAFARTSEVKLLELSEKTHRLERCVRLFERKVGHLESAEAAKAELPSTGPETLDLAAQAGAVAQAAAMAQGRLTAQSVAAADQQAEGMPAQDAAAAVAVLASANCPGLKAGAQAEEASEVAAGAHREAETQLANAAAPPSLAAAAAAVAQRRLARRGAAGAAKEPALQAAAVPQESSPRALEQPAAATSTSAASSAPAALDKPGEAAPARPANPNGGAAAAVDAPPPSPLPTAQTARPVAVCLFPSAAAAKPESQQAFAAPAAPAAPVAPPSAVPAGITPEQAVLALRRRLLVQDHSDDDMQTDIGS
eukprot:CAMPEP_0195147204 /NCGR_PEP_ID=MMETSP0448-20130528/173011_1 /TAXON_ID=66468 /ORGANISM="Heterocapsa triquestra, Strain CCMP 448" /LENGTH=338 /DNA_ID=CAMNT_0040185779 /DNA_START=9 /DNA_END=1021 /DNA_ORIENTATION=-